MMAQFEYTNHIRGHGLALYFEDEFIALDTWDRSRSGNDHEILLDAGTVDRLIEAFTAMKVEISSRYQKAITA